MAGREGSIMRFNHRLSRVGWGRRNRRGVSLRVEPLEGRTLLTGSGSVGPVALTLLNEAEPNDTLDKSQQLSTLSRPIQVAGRIGNGLGGGADVDWYSFTLTHAATVGLGTSRVGAQGWTVLSLYND